MSKASDDKKMETPEKGISSAGYDLLCNLAGRSEIVLLILVAPTARPSNYVLEC